MTNHNLLLNREIDLKTSFEWIKLSFYNFRKAPVQYILLQLFKLLITLLTLTVAIFVIKIIPGIAISLLLLVLGFLGPIIESRYAWLANQIEMGNSVTVAEILSGLLTNRKIILLGVIGITLNVFLILIQALFTNFFNHYGLASQLLVIITSILTIICVSFTWLAPTICTIYEEITPVEALWLSFKASWFNVFSLTLVLYFVFVAAFMLLAIIPVGLGLIIWVPIWNISLYYVCKNVFIRA